VAFKTEIHEHKKYLNTAECLNTMLRNTALASLPPTSFSEPPGGMSSINGRYLNINNATISFSLHVVQTGSGVHPTSYTMGTGSSFPRVKRPGREADHSPPTSAGVKKMWIYTSTPPYAFMA
jgi:hypothetical protein